MKHLIAGPLRAAESAHHPSGLRKLVVLISCFATLIASVSVADAQRLIFVEALSEFTQAIAGIYGDEGARIGPALDKMASGLAEWDRAIQDFESRLASAPRDASTPTAVDLRVTLARMYLERGRLADAIRELDTATRLAPQRADLHLLRGLALEQLNRFAEAGDAFGAAWSRDANDPIKAYYVFHASSRTDNAAEAERARQALGVAYRALLGDSARTKSSPFGGLELLHDIASDTLILTPAAYAQGFARLARGEYQEAVAEFRQASTLDPLVTDPAAQSPSMTKAVAALRQGNIAGARSLLEASPPIPASSETHRMLGVIHWAESRDEESIAQLEMATRVNGRDERSRLALARVLTSAGRNQDAARVLQETVRRNPDSAQAHWWLASSHQQDNQIADARREFELAARGIVAGGSQLHASIGRLAADSGDFPGASTEFARAVSANPNDANVRKNLAGTLLLQDRIGEAFAEFVAALLIDPADAGAHLGIGQIFLNSGHYEEAVAALRRAVGLAANFTEARYALATALTRLGNTQEAATEFERVDRAQRQTLADRRRSMTLDVLKEEAALRAAEGNYSQAIEQLEAAAKLETDPEIYRRLAELYAKVGRVEDAARAASLYDKARKGSPAGGTSR